MSRFDSTRRGKILVWTGAALAWGTAGTITSLETARVDSAVASPPPTLAPAEISQYAALPSIPAQGLVILRYQPSTNNPPEVRTVYVEQTASALPVAARPANTPAPSPQSSGS